MINKLKDRSRLIGPAKVASFQIFLLLDKFGIHLMPKHYYTPVPDYRWLRSNRGLWDGQVAMRNLGWELDSQFEWLSEICSPYYSEVKGLEFYRSTGRFGEGFGPIESQVLHCFVRSIRPHRIVEVGSGASTACMLNAIKLNPLTTRTSVTCIEPYPKKAFLELGEINHVMNLCQAAPPQIFDQLEEGDLLFIDSSHSVKTGSDVNHLLLRVMPSLKPGVYVHIHDINFPYLYNRDALENYLGWQETALLYALLTNNQHLRTLVCLSALHYDRPADLQGLLPDYMPQDNDHGLRKSADSPGHFPASIWLQTK